MKEINLSICRDFSGNEAMIKQTLSHFLGTKLRLAIKMQFLRLSKESIADTYAYLIRKDKLNKLAKFCIPIKTEEFEAFLK